jgi:hypothetical protein
VTASGKLPPFLWQSRAAMDRLLELFPEELGPTGRPKAPGRSSALSIYTALALIASRQKRPDHCEIKASRREVARAAGVSDRTVDAVAKKLEAGGLLRVVRTRIGTRNLENVWTLLEPESSTVERSARKGAKDPKPGSMAAFLARREARQAEEQAGAGRFSEYDMAAGPTEPSEEFLRRKGGEMISLGVGNQVREGGELSSPGVAQPFPEGGEISSTPREEGLQEESLQEGEEGSDGSSTTTSLTDSSAGPDVVVGEDESTGDQPPPPADGAQSVREQQGSGSETTKPADDPADDLSPEWREKAERYRRERALARRADEVRAADPWLDEAIAERLGMDRDSVVRLIKTPKPSNELFAAWPTDGVPVVAMSAEDMLRSHRPETLEALAEAIRKLPVGAAP